jgi:hypothetical protein
VNVVQEEKIDFILDGNSLMSITERLRVEICAETLGYVLKMPSAAATTMSSNDTESLQDVCLEHLKLINKMSEVIVAKNREIRMLKSDNQKVRCCKRAIFKS